MSLVTITINNQTIHIEEGSSILQAARQGGFDIPTLCHADHLKPFTSCFICAVKVHGGRDTLVPSCATLVREGMIVTVEDPELEASRRMAINLLLSDHCGDCQSPCQSACPSNIDIAGFLALIREGKTAEAARLIREQAPFPGILGRICPRPCEEVCRRQRVEEPIAICNMKRYIADAEVEHFGSPQLPCPGTPTGKRVAIVGAGPAGMSAAYYLRLAGHQVRVFEQRPASGGMLRYGIPYYRLPEKVLKTELEAVADLGVELCFGITVGTHIAAQDLEQDFDALILGIGAQGATPLGIPGEELPGVWPGIGYLEAVAERNPPELGDRVVVVGGGNTAIDCARTVLREGKGRTQVSILYRRGREEMPAQDAEIAEALHEGVKIEYLTAPMEILREGEELIITLSRMELTAPDASGRRSPVPIPGSAYQIRVSAVLAALGQQVLPDLARDLGLETTRRGTIKVDPRTFQTGRPGIFACGDCQSGAATAVRAVGNGRKTAYSVHQYLSGLPLTGEPVLFNSSMGPLKDLSTELFTGYTQAERVRMPVISDEERRTTDNEVETGVEPALAMKEAARCLSCGCDAQKDCKLRRYATRYQGDQGLFGSPASGGRRGYRLDKSHEKIKLEVHKCINCGACVRACAEIKGLNVLAYINRGFTTRIHVPFGRSLVDTACDGCGECTKVCPTAGIMPQQTGTTI
ncbi:FAD-dependent oxidoreductase [Hollandina sp. SP2]